MRGVEKIVRMRLKGRTLDIRMSIGDFQEPTGANGRDGD